MKNQEVEILKIGIILPSTISRNDIIDGKQVGKSTIMIVNNGGPIFDHYISILIESCNQYKYLKTHKNIIGSPHSYRPGENDDRRLIGKLDGDLVVGMSFTVGSWHSSVVKKIINNNIVITNNSAYAIHSLSEFRNSKIEDLGL
jgi:hypothetical protein